MFQLLDKLAESGGAENIYFDWWSQNDELEVSETPDDIGDKNKVQQILLNLCYKVKKIKSQKNIKINPKIVSTVSR